MTEGLALYTCMSSFVCVVVLKTLESPLDCKEIQPIHPKGDHSWVFIGSTDAEAKTPILWPPCAKSWLTGKDPDAGRDWGQEEKGMIYDEMAEWHHQLYGHEFEWTLGVGDEQGGQVCCDSWGRKESDTTEQLNWTDWIALQCYVSFCCTATWISYICTYITTLYSSFLLNLFGLIFFFCTSFIGGHILCITFNTSYKERKWSHSVVSDSLWPHEL